ncbi:hypothetical protein JFV28_17995 [Pseudomonas sp. TH05]|uniref:hypothetical protein n=1 Tax=unclassified Pseudomonas TaxID=196821 RepID=UPI001912A79A|nr:MULTISPECIES: hypothetical protein [unclassified Pseudomonas]MBK5538459.1 hypothetical protein [Pseudomonas sp. TH07]MBK5557738.1 hypothetical protein [Pseudomonas sp. TH05]
MSFYMITYGMTQIEDLFIGETKENTVANARELIDQWPEYAELSDEEIVELAKSEQTEFDLVEINAPWPIDGTNRSHLIALYEQRYS